MTGTYEAEGNRIKILTAEDRGDAMVYSDKSDDIKKMEYIVSDIYSGEYYSIMHSDLLELNNDGTFSSVHEYNNR